MSHKPHNNNPPINIAAMNDERMVCINHIIRILHGLNKDQLRALQLILNNWDHETEVRADLSDPFVDSRFRKVQ